MALVGFFTLVALSAGQELHGEHVTALGWATVLMGLPAAAAIVREVLSRIAHKRVRRWTQQLPFKLVGYPKLLGVPALFSIYLTLEMESDDPDQELLKSSVLGMGYSWLTFETHRKNTVRVESDYWYGATSNWSAHQRIRRTVQDWVNVVHRSDPVKRVIFEFRQF